MGRYRQASCLPIPSVYIINQHLFGTEEVPTLGKVL